MTVGQRILSPAQEAEMLRRERVVMEERLRGKSFYRIEREHGIANADRVFKRAVNRPENAPVQRAEALRLENLRMDALQDGLWDRALSGDPRSVEICLKVLERRAKLNGLDFQDLVSGRLVEVEQAKVAVMASALAEALRAAALPDQTRREVQGAFFAALRAAAAHPLDGGEPAALASPVLDPEDEDLL